MERAYKSARRQLTTKRMFDNWHCRESALVPSVGTVERMVIPLNT